MSNTVITNYSDISGNISKPGKQLVVLVNKDGTVSFEKSVFQSLLDDKGSENTSVSLVHINEDGKPADASDDSSDDENVPHVNLTVNAFYDPETCDAFDKGTLDESYILDSRDYFMIGFQNDHCYTPHTSPEHSQQHKVEIPSSKKITIIENKIIPKDKKFINLNTADAQIILRRTDILKKIVESQKGNHNLLNLNNKTVLNIVGAEHADKLKQEDKLNNVVEKTSESSSESLHDDRDSDSDYHSRSRKTPLKPNKPKTINKTVKNLLTKKIETKRNIPQIHHIEVPPQYKHAKTYKVKSFSKANSIRHIVTKKLKKTISPKNDSNRPTHPYSDGKVLAEGEPQKTEPPKLVKIIHKKDKKPPAHMTALLNDMTSLFSTPHILRRMSTDAKQSPKAPDTPTNIVIKKSNKEFFANSPAISATPDKIPNFSKNKIMKSETKTYSNKTINKNSRDINQHLANKSSVDSSDLGTLEDANLGHLYPEQHLGILPSNISDLDSLAGKHEPLGTNPLLLSPTSLSSSHLGAPLSPSLDLLGGLHPEEEGLTEDLLMHVAQLVESSENLQEVIDKQVLGKVDEAPAKEMHLVNLLSQNLPKMENLNHSMLHLAEKQTISTPPAKPIQIVRSNGRVITLPPIEAPATRSSKRKSLLNAVVDSIPMVIPPPVVKVATPAVQSPIPKPLTPSSKKVIHKAPEQPTVPPKKPEGDDDENAESDESWNSEDDPDRLWCICKQPHNNRFMICCDLCEDWFHGKCVNITKAMGQEMEEKGVEWRCPNCLKKKSMKPNSPRISTDSRLKTEVADNETYLHLAGTANKHAGNTNCIVCKKAARPSSIYCSDVCILKHAQESSNQTPTPKVHPVQNMPLKNNPDTTRVIVYERETGRCLAGPSAPTAANLKVWLQDNPTFEVVQPGTMNRPSININKERIKINTQKVQSVLKVNQDKQIILMQPPKGSPANKNQAQPSKPLTPKTPTPKVIPAKPDTPKTLTLKIASPKEQVTPKPTTPKPTTPKPSTPKPTTPKLTTPKPTTPKPTTPKLLIPKQPTVKPGLKSPPTPKTPTSQKQPSLKSPTTPTYHKREEGRPRMNSTEPIRENVRKTLQEQLSLRMSETKDVKFTSSEIHKFAIDTEHELYDLFRDVGIKYKAKYRSLMFNLKDRKNLSLWEKICNHSITPTQLVRLSAEELASQELAQWRDKEVKHQLELIKKSELDLLSCSKTYVLKTHKGEEVIESRTTDTTELDPNVALEDIVTALNHVPGEDDNSDEKGKDSRSPSPLHHRHHSHPSHPSHPLHLSHHKHSKHKSRSHSKSSKSSSKKDHSSERNKVTSDKHESSRESKSSSNRSRHKSSRDTAKSRGSSKHHERSRKSSRTTKSKVDHKTSPDRKQRKRSHSSDASKELEKRRSSSPSKDVHNRSLSKESDNKQSTKKSRIDEAKDDLSLNIIDPITPIDDKSKVVEPSTISKELLNNGDILIPKECTNIDSPPTPGTPDILENHLGADSDQEPSSTVDSTLSSLWSGSVSMIDVAKFNVTAFEVSGHCDYITKDLESELEIVGRISPEIVWDYINKMKKQGNKDIMVIKLMPSNEEEKIQYNVFFSYLNSRNRLGVVRAHGGIKDFYVLPLTSHAPLPSVLLPLNGPGFEDNRPQLLLGIIVGQKKKRSSSHLSSIPTKIAKLKETSERSYTPPPTSSYTPPSSPRRSSTSTLSCMPLPAFHPTLSSTVKSKIAASLASADDEPYSPGGSDSVSQSPPPAASTDLQRKMEELNRKIEEQKKQIENMATNSNESLDEPYSPSKPMSPEAALTSINDISLPSNLQEILASINKISKPPGTEDTPQESYIPTAISINMSSTNPTYYQARPSSDVDMRVPGSISFTLPPLGTTGYVPESKPKSPSKLASLSEAELLSMVPDEEVFPPLPSIPVAPPPLPGTDMSVPPPPYIKHPSIDMDQPPPPGLEGDEN